MSQLEILLGSARQMANPNKERHSPERSQDFVGIREIHLGRMLALVSIQPQSTLTKGVTLNCFGDAKQLDTLRPTVQDGTLSLTAELPFKPGSSRQGHGGVFSTGGGSVIIRGGSISVRGGASVSNVSIGGGNSMSIINGVLFVDGREVDLTRHMVIEILTPPLMDVHVDDLIGAVGIMPNLNGTIDFSSSSNANLYAHDANRVIGNIHGQGSAEVLIVRESVETKISGQGGFTFNSVGGTVDAKVSGQGSIRINGGNSRSMEAKVSGQGSIEHHGTVNGDADLRVSGQGSITVRQATGRVNPKVTGQGHIRANGQTYRPRW